MTTTTVVAAAAAADTADTTSARAFPYPSLVIASTNPVKLDAVRAALADCGAASVDVVAATPTADTVPQPFGQTQARAAAYARLASVHLEPAQVCVVIESYCDTAPGADANDMKTFYDRVLVLVGTCANDAFEPPLYRHMYRLGVLAAPIDPVAEPDWQQRTIEERLPNKTFPGMMSRERQLRYVLTDAFDRLKAMHALRAAMPVCADFPKPGVNFVDMYAACQSPARMRQITAAMQRTVGHVDNLVVLGIESRGVTLATMLAHANGAPLLVVRKAGKVPPAGGRPAHAVTYDTEYSTATLEMTADVSSLPPLDDEDDYYNVVIVDDVVATGGSMVAAARLLAQHPRLRLHAFLALFPVLPTAWRAPLEARAPVHFALRVPMLPTAAAAAPASASAVDDQLMPTTTTTTAAPAASATKMTTAFPRTRTERIFERLRDFTYEFDLASVRRAWPATQWRREWLHVLTFTVSAGIGTVDVFLSSDTAGEASDKTAMEMRWNDIVLVDENGNVNAAALRARLNQHDSATQSKGGDDDDDDADDAAIALFLMRVVHEFFFQTSVFVLPALLDVWEDAMDAVRVNVAPL